MQDVVIVGGSAAGITVAETLRHRGFRGTIQLLDHDEHALVDRPPLSKQVLSGAWNPERAALRTTEELRALDLEFVAATAAAVDRPAGEVSTLDGRTFRFDVLVAATGLKPRWPAGWLRFAGVHTVHRVTDSLGLRGELTRIRRIVVIGGGVLGCEVTATARAMGVEVVLLDELPTPMYAHLGRTVGGLVRSLHESNGVKVVTSARVTGLLGDAENRVVGVDLGSRVLEADAVVLAIGGVPQVEWLSGCADVTIGDGVECDEQCRAADNIYAVGDIARWHHRGLGRSMRLENRTNATEQARAVAAAILGDLAPYVPVPYFWSDQYHVKIQVFGAIMPNDVIEFIEGSPDEGRFVALSRTDSKVNAVIGWNHPRQVRIGRTLIADQYLPVDR